MRKQISTAVLGFAAFLGVGNAFAGQDAATFTTTLVVESYCQITDPAGDIYHIHDAGVLGNNTFGVEGTSMQVLCNRDLPYTIEVDSATNGGVILTDTATAKVLPAKLLIYDQLTDPAHQTWGSVANGEEYHHIGTGFDQNIGLFLQYDTGVIPDVGIYTDTRNLTLSY